MAKRTYIRLTDDIDGSVGDDTVRFSLNGQGYEIDLSKANIERLEKALEPFTSHGRRLMGPFDRSPGIPKAQTSAALRREADAIRAWALANGYDVKFRGAIPNAVKDAYHTARRAGTLTMPALIERPSEATAKPEPESEQVVPKKTAATKKAPAVAKKAPVVNPKKTTTTDAPLFSGV